MSKAEGVPGRRWSPRPAAASNRGGADRCVFALLVSLALLLISRGPNSMSGDAPHYLAISDSLVFDRDLDLSNQYQGGRYLFFHGDPGLHAVVGRGGKRYSIHYPGLPILATPFYFAAERAASVAPPDLLQRLRWDRGRMCRDLLSVVMALVYAWTAVLTMRLCRDLGIGEWPARLGTVLAFATPPLLSMSILFFTEVPAACLSVVALRFVADTNGTSRSAFPAVLAIATLPWLHMRYAPLALVLVLVVLLMRREAAVRDRAIVVLAPAVSVALLCVLNGYMFGSLSPAAQYGVGNPLTTSNWLTGLVGIFVDRDYGLLAVAPFWALAIFALGGGGIGAPSGWYRVTVAVVLVSTWLLVTRHGMWWGGHSPSARFLVPVLPMMVPVLASAVSRASARGVIARVSLILLIAWSALMTGTLVGNPSRLWSSFNEGLGLLSAIPAIHTLWPSLAGPRVSWLAVAAATTVIAVLVALAEVVPTRLLKQGQGRIER